VFPRLYQFPEPIKEGQRNCTRELLSIRRSMARKKGETKPISRSAAYRHKNGGRKPEQKWEDQKRLTKDEEQNLLASIRMMLQNNGRIHTSEVHTLTTEVLRCRSLDQHDGTVSQQHKPLGKNWPNTFLKTHCEELKIRYTKGLGWLASPADFVATPSDVEQLCSECASITLRLEAVLPRESRGSRKLHTFQYSTVDIESLSCKLCKFVQICARNWNWPTSDKYSLFIHHLDGVVGPALGENKILLSVSIEDQSSKHTYNGWIVPTLLGNGGRNVIEPAWGQPGVTVDFDEMRNWLRFCDQHHLADCRMPELDKIPYFSLIDCATRSIVNAPDQAEFVALSYCWGPPTDSEPNDTGKLPPVAPLVIEDALKVTIALGIPYLWVDRYCNAQSDPSILSTQVQNMGKIYASAYVTIIAAAGVNPDFGLPGVSSRCRKPQVSVKTHGHHLACVPDIEQEIRNCRWSTRGWCYQENLLSKRRLAFTESQIYFQCWNMHCCESTPLCLEKAHTTSLERFRESIQTRRVFPRKGVGKTSDEFAARVQEYLNKDFTKDSDALKAFLGICQAFRELDQPVYHFWGLPIVKGRSMNQIGHSSGESNEFDELHKSFLSSLAWSMSSCKVTSVYLLTRRDMFPTWTWAAWKCLPHFSQKFVTENLYSPSVNFKTYQGQMVGLEQFERTLGPSDCTVLFEPCVYLAGWVTDVRLSQTDSDTESGFQVSWPIPTRRVAIVADAKTAISLRQKISTKLFQVLLLGSESSCGNEEMAPLGSPKEVHAIILQPGPKGTHKRLGVVTWNRLGKPTFDDGGTRMRVTELFEARRIGTQCPCGCVPLDAARFDVYLEHSHHTLEFQKCKIALV
jgi:hypothetical protein